MKRKEIAAIIDLIRATADALNNQRKGLAEKHTDYKGRYLPETVATQFKLMDLAED